MAEIGSRTERGLGMFKSLIPGGEIQVLRKYFKFTKTKGVATVSNQKWSRPSSEFPTSPHKENPDDEVILKQKREGLQRFNLFWLGDE